MQIVKMGRHRGLRPNTGARKRGRERIGEERHHLPRTEQEEALNDSDGETNTLTIVNGHPTYLLCLKLRIVLWFAASLPSQRGQIVKERNWIRWIIRDGQFGYHCSQKFSSERFSLVRGDDADSGQGPMIVS